MANVVNRTTMEYRRSVNTPDFPEPDWMVVQDETPVTQVVGDPDPGRLWPARYWVLTGDILSIQDAATRAATDVARAAVTVAELHTSLKTEINAAAPLGVDVRALILNANKRINYAVNRLTEIQAALDAVKTTTGGGDNIRAAIPDSWLATNTRPLDQAITDYEADIDAGEAD